MRIAVVGRGLIGSAAARHLALAGHEVALVGPAEPEDRRSHTGVFASHYDEGRITRGLDPDPFWSRVSRASIARYAGIAAASGTDFYAEVGTAMAGPKGSDLVARTEVVGRAAGLSFDVLEGAALADRFPFFAFPEGTVALHEPRGAGHISPRRLVQAQGIAAARAGARIVEAVATGLTETGTGVTLRTDGGEVEAESVLVCAGGFTNMVLPAPLPLTVYARTVALARVGATEAARLSAMPSLIWLDPNGDDPYLLPPIRYPDGGTWLKLGGDPVDVVAEDADAARAWFRSGGNAAVAERQIAAMRARLPGLSVEAVRHEACVVTFSDRNLPLIGPVSDRVTVAAAGCGKGAKCSDELGRLGAEAVLGRVDPALAP
jgi:sarcosine oxidase